MEAKMIRHRDCEFQDGSYPCEYEDGGKLPDCELCHKIRKAGIRKAVEWLETGAYFRNADKLCIHGYKAKLKEWGIE